MHCLQASLMSADFLLLSWLYWTLCTPALRFAHIIFYRLWMKARLHLRVKKGAVGVISLYFFSYLFIYCDFVYHNYNYVFQLSAYILTIMYNGLS